MAEENKEQMFNGVHVEYSNVNQAYFVMWFDQVLRIFNSKEEAQVEADRISANPQPALTALLHQFDGWFKDERP